MKKILIALDYNPSAQKVAETGYTLAKAMNAKTILLHVVSDVTYYSSVNYSPIMGFGGLNSLDTIQTHSIEEIKKTAQLYLDKSKQNLKDDRIQTVVKNGDYGATILKTARDLDIDIIVMGTHGRRGFEKILVGSVAEEVLRLSPIPLFIIPTKEIDSN
jgi:nucleotide-binding universal stress UspA family protein